MHATIMYALRFADNSIINFLNPLSKLFIKHINVNICESK